MEAVELYKNKVGILSNWLVSKEYGLITEQNYKQLKHRNRIRTIRAGGNGRTALIDYNSIPDRLKQDILRKLNIKSPFDIINRKPMVEEYIVFDEKVSDFFADFKLADGRNLKPEKQRLYYTNYIVLDGIKRMLESKRNRLSGKGEKLKVDWDEVAKGIWELDRDNFPHKLPTVGRRLEDRFKCHLNNGFAPEGFIDKHYFNVSAAKIQTDVQKAFVIKLLRLRNNLPDTLVSEEYNLMAEAMGWKTVTDRNIGVWREKYSLEIHAERYGSTSAANNIAMQTKRSRPTMPMLYWTMDGWVAELLYQKTEFNKKANCYTTTYHNRLTAYVIIDPCCDYIVGYAIGENESPALITEALRNASNHIAELFGERLRPHQIQSDNYQIKAMMPIYEAMAKYVTPAKVKNAKAKVVEPWFNHKMNAVCQIEPNWSGHNVTALKKNQPNMGDLRTTERHNFPDEAGCRRQIEMKIARLRAEKIGEYKQLWETMPQDKKLPMNREKYLYYFGDVRHKRNGDLETNHFTGAGIIATIGGEQYTYDCFDLNFRKNMGVDWILRYDPNDLKTVLATNADGTLRFLLEEKYVQPMALAERTDGDSEQLQRVRDFNKEIVEYVNQVKFDTDELVYDFIRKNTDAVQELTAHNDTLYKHIIPDSRGQHKEQLQAQRAIEAGAKMEIKYTRKKELELARGFADDRREYIKSKVDLSQYVDVEI
ncbi:MAG: hypothetical protein LBN27_00075 [Prevotellaceae bacterium]|jgi:hypothetical protein|nr:hypothetical protein [Prevotellaceae bacterium]